MTRKFRVVRQIAIAALLCGIVSLAQEPVQNVSKERHPNLAEAQHLIAEANQRIIAAQRDNHDDMKGHAEKARQLLVQASEEIKLGAEAANAAAKH